MDRKYEGRLFRNAGPNVHPVEVLKWAATLPHSVPPDYVAYLCQCNGGEPAAKWAPTRMGWKGDGEAIVFFLSVKAPKKERDVDAVRASFAKTLDAGWLPIARTEADNYYLLNISGEDGVCGVHFWNRAKGPVDWRQHTEPVAGSFAQLIDALDSSAKGKKVTGH